jgi:hypothetical protein
MPYGSLWLTGCELRNRAFSTKDKISLENENVNLPQKFNLQTAVGRSFFSSADIFLTIILYSVFA